MMVIVILCILVLFLVISLIISDCTKKVEITHISEPYKIVRMETETYKNSAKRYITLENDDDRVVIRVDHDIYYDYIEGDEVHLDIKTYKSLFHMVDATGYVICEED